jgi:yeast amino acid transporter
MCSDIPLVTTAFVLWKVIKKTKIVKLADIPLAEALDRAARDPGEERKVPKWRQAVGFLWD